jgi:DNA invertase Pin-like site-specific DNA recombinase
LGTVPTCDIYLRLSDARLEEAFAGREANCRAQAAALGWTVRRVVVENDVLPDGRAKPASAWKRRRVKTPSGEIAYRVIRPAFRGILDDLASGVISALLGEDLDRIVRDPRDMEDLIDVCAMTKASVRSISGSLKLTNGGDEPEKYVARILVAGANKASADTSRRMKDSKEREWERGNYFGGARPYGYVKAQDTTKYHRTLIVVPDEADIIREAADAILDKDIPLRAMARDLRNRPVLNAHGKTNWTSQSLKRILTKPSVAGLAAYKGQLKDAPWDAILDRDAWERLCAKLNDPTRRFDNMSNEPKYLLSGIALCGVCNDGQTVRAGGRRDNSFYACHEGYHLKRRVRICDAWVERNITAYISRYRVDIGKPEPRTDIDRDTLQAEAKRLRERKASQIRMHALGDIDDADLSAGLRIIRDRLRVIEAQLAQSSQPDPIPEFRGRHAHARQIWESLPLARKRAILRKLATVTILPTAARGKAPFDPGSVRIVVKETGDALDVRGWGSA